MIILNQGPRGNQQNGITQVLKANKFKITLSMGKIMAMVFWVEEGESHVDFLPLGITVNSKSPCELH